MKIALIGYGKMGQLVDEIAQEKGHQVISRSSREIDLEGIEEADVCIDFSHPSRAMGNLVVAANLGTNMVMGTTGWYDLINDAREIVKYRDIGFFYASNFSLGVNLFLKIVSEAANLMGAMEEYDVGIAEAHHSKKADSPSGTALTIAHALMKKMQRKTAIINTPKQGPVAPNELLISSLRCGFIPGTHQVHFESANDSITLTHQARNREGFARGAVAAAEWLEGKKGFYTVDDMLEG